MAKRGNQGYGKTELVKWNVDKFSPLFWQLMEKYAKSKIKGDQRFFMQEFNKLQVKMVPSTIQGDEDGGPIKVTVTNYGSKPTLQVYAEGLSTTATPSN